MSGASHAVSPELASLHSQDKLANWFEAYVESMELNYWPATEFESGVYDEKEERWSVSPRLAEGGKRQMRPRHVVMATGVSGIPSLPDIPTLGEFGGKVLHSSQYHDGKGVERQKRPRHWHRQ